MGRVFTFEEIAAGRVPEVSDVLHVDAAARRALSRSPAVSGALVFGSTAHGGATRRSDVDLVAVFTSGHHREARALIASIEREALARHVPVRAELLGRNNLARRRGRYGGGVLFVRFLALAARTGGLVKGDPLPLIHVEPGAPDEDLQRYVEARRRVLLAEARARRGSAAEARLLAAALRAPVHAARKFLQARGVDFTSGRRDEVISLYRDAGPRRGARLLDRVVEIDLAYTEALDRHVRRADELAYGAALDGLRAAPPLALDLLAIHDRSGR